MRNQEIHLVEGDIYDGVLLETCKEMGKSRPRVRPIDFIDRDVYVEFPRSLRENNPLKTRFRASVKVCQKHHRKGELKGKPKGEPYLRAKKDSIFKVKDFTPNSKVKPVKLNTISDRVYKYIQEENSDESQEINLLNFRKKAYKNSSTNPTTNEASYTRFDRNDLIKIYALARANGNCEACDKPAPFLKKNNDPYLEIHHINELSKNGPDSPKNVAAICPNCHARVTHGKNSLTFNRNLEAKIIEKENQFEKN